jgi:asparagine synthase (glutamine-hydrolysing)
MCGITGVISGRSAQAWVRLMTAAVEHRGPDDVGFADLKLPNGSSGGMFGHRRLSILDLTSAGHQPMISPDGRYSLTYNGEIYNHAAIRAELAHEGVQFRSTGDTEVLLLGWAHYGSAILSRLRGMFAFALWDRDEGRLFMARDPFGIKPLYIVEAGSALLFASEIRALLASGAVPRKFSAAAVATYLSSGSVAEPLTIIEGIWPVPAGCLIDVSLHDSGVTIGEPVRFATALSEPIEPAVGLASGTFLLRDALRDSVRHHLVSDVPVGLFLSGGLDSSSMVGLASEVSETSLESFTVTFAEADFSEAEPARAVAERFGIRHHEIPLSADDLLNALPDFFSAMDQPSLDGLNTFVVSRAIQKYGMKVVLSGLGGDELFAGYPSFHRAAFIAPLWNLPAGVRRFGAVGASQFGDLRAEKIETLLKYGSPAKAAYHGSRTLFGTRYVRALMGDSFADAVSPYADADDVNTERLSTLQEVSLYELTGYMRNTLLRDSDVFSMAHGLELRVPFVDRAVARAAASAIDGAKLKRGASKPLLVEAVRDLLPPALIDRPKQGFTLPFERWMRKEMLDEVNSLLTDGRADLGGLRQGAVSHVWNDFLSGRAGMNWSRPWALYTLLRWAKQNEVSFDTAMLQSGDLPALSAAG